MSHYPYTLDHPCPVCKSPIVVKRRRKKIPDYCSVECYNSSIQKYSKIITNRICPKCSKAFQHHKNRFCSKKCSNQFKSKTIAKFKTCQHCQNEYQIKKELGNHYSKYCSRDCFTQAKITKYSVDVSALSSAYLLGQIWSSALIKDLLEIRFYGNSETLIEIADSLKTGYKIRKTRSEVWNNYFRTTHVLAMYNRELISKLIDLGLDSPVFRNWPQITQNQNSDFFQGYCDSVKKQIKVDEIWFCMVSKDMARSAQEKFSGSICYTEGDWWWIRKI